MRKTRLDTRRSMLGTGLFVLAPLLTAACSSDAPEAAPGEGAVVATVYEGARLITGDGGPPIEDAVFVVEGGRFTAVGGRGEVEVPAGAVRVDLSGKTVMPALIDAHKHLAAGRDEVVDQLRHMAYYGVGGALSMGLDEGDVAFQLRSETLPGVPRLRTAGQGITAPEPGRSEVPHWVTTEEEAREAVRGLAERDVDMVKIWVDDRDGQYEKLSPELYGAVIDEAHRQGLRVAAHIFALDDAKGLLRAGVDVFAHGIRDRDLDDETIALFRERPEVALIPNMGDRGVASDLGWLEGTVPAAELGEMQARATDRPETQEAYGIQARNLARLHEAGVPISLGTDGSTPWAVHQEMEDMVAAGMTPAEVIVASTRSPAALLRLTDAGTVEAGKSADFVVLDANPLDDITHTRRIDAVYLRGDAVDREGLGARLTAAQPASQ